MELVTFGKNDQRQVTYSWEKCLHWVVSVVQAHNSANLHLWFPVFTAHIPSGLYLLYLGVLPSLPGVNTPQHSSAIPAVLLLLLLSHSHPSSGRARVIIFFLQAPFKFSLFKFRISLHFVLALAIKLESSPEISLIKKKGGNILISIPAIILQPFVVSLVQGQVLTRDKYRPSADLAHLQQKGYTCWTSVILDFYYKV